MNPFGFQKMNTMNVWMLPYQCKNVEITLDGITPFSDWFWWTRKDLLATLSALTDISLSNDYSLVSSRLNRVCYGWSDLFYIPRSLWSDYQVLAGIFKEQKVFHEFAVPTIMDILLQKFPVVGLDTIADCWGGAVTVANTTDEILNHRCGHQLPLYRNDLVSAHFDRLRQTKILL
jgi:hypothetical protein